MLQLITHRNTNYSDLEFAKEALEGGCRWVQLRMKEGEEDEVRKIAFEMKQLCDAYGAVFIIDDRVELVLETGAKGVHLGKNDMPIIEARRVLGPEFVIGGTANTLEDMVAIAQDGGDYIGLGPFRFTATKKNLSPILGLEGYREITQQFRRLGFTLPIVAIGGITLADIDDIMATGVSGIALSSEILQSENPKERTKQIIEKIGLIND